MYFNREIGKRGENLATQYLLQNHYKILKRNFYARKGEIDIIAKEKKEIVFIEVKTRSNLLYGNPADAVDNNKKRHIYQTAQYYTYINKLENKPIRFDVIEVYINMRKKTYYLNHLKNIEY